MEHESRVDQNPNRQLIEHLATWATWVSDSDSAGAQRWQIRVLECEDCAEGMNALVGPAGDELTDDFFPRYRFHWQVLGDETTSARVLVSSVEGSRDFFTTTLTATIISGEVVLTGPSLIEVLGADADAQE